MKEIKYVHSAVNPDLDGVACAAGYAFYLRATGVEAFACLHGKPDGEAKFHIERLVEVPWIPEDSVPQPNDAVIVDFSWLNGLSPKVDPAWVSEIIDHHVFNDSGIGFPNAKIDIQEVGAAATIIVERIGELELSLPRAIAEALYGAIYSNTQSLRGAITTQRDVTSARWLAERYRLDNTIIYQQYAARTQSIADDIRLAICAERFIKPYLEDPKKNYGVAQFEVLNAKEFWLKFKTEILASLAPLAEPSILNLVDAIEGYSVIYINEPFLREKFLKNFDIAEQLNDDCFIMQPSILRKMIFRLI